MNHEVDIYDCYFDKIKSGNKTCLVIDNTERQFQEGDTIIFSKLNNLGREVLGEKLSVEITYVYSGTELKRGYVVLSFDNIKVL